MTNGGVMENVFPAGTAGQDKVRQVVPEGGHHRLGYDLQELHFWVLEEAEFHQGESMEVPRQSGPSLILLRDQGL